MPPPIPISPSTQRVYDYGAVTDPVGGVDWFNSRIAEPAVLIETLANILYPELGLRGPSLGNAWWQNVFTESSCSPATLPTQEQLASTCTAAVAAEPFLPALNTECPTPAPTPAPSVATAAPTDPPSAPANTDGSLSTSSSSDDPGSNDTALIVGIAAVAAALVGVSVALVLSRRQVVTLESSLVGPSAGGGDNGGFGFQSSAVL